ncbi:hypothetical protein E2C01_040712 [Portunus trituberculatus]|uniref:Uncharacterized protein n=1 Tax=Portunus trituberculatus TaxID=210409 RepID=A0A5B7FNY7_PORTR|nr:hypothetical protein [Portunus trituberculatus]
MIEMIISIDISEASHINAERPSAKYSTLSRVSHFHAKSVFVDCNYKTQLLTPPTGLLSLRLTSRRGIG